MRHRAYPRYKPSGVEWLGQLPSHWDVARFSRVIRIAEGQVDPEDERYAFLLLIAPNHVESGTGRLIARETAAEQGAESGKHRCQRGEVIYSKIRPGLAKVTLAPEDCLCSADMYPLACGTGLSNRYVCWLLLSQPFTAWSVLESERVAMPKINRDTLRELRLPLPPPGEQDAIAALLDDQTATLDGLIATKTALVERLQEKRSALILRTVTRGLPADAARASGTTTVSTRLRGSRIEWLGDVPGHWETGCLRRYAQMRTGHTPSRTEPQYWDDGDIPWFTLADVWQLRDGRQMYLGETAERISRLGLANSAAELLPAGTVVFSRTASVGFSGIMPIPMATSQDFWNWVPGPKLASEYLLYLFRSMRPEFERLTMGSTHKTIYQPDAARLAICVPPLQEQRAIVEYLNRATARIDMLIAKVEAAIERLQEYRAALITAAVTGQIDVRGQGTPGLPAAAGSG